MTDQTYSTFVRRNFKRLLCLFLMTILSAVVLTGQTGGDNGTNDKIVESVSVNWWQVPVIAVDKNGNSVTDLKPGDISILVNKQPVSTFHLYRHAFSASHMSTETKEAKPVKEFKTKKNMVVLLFDLALSTSTANQWSRPIVKEIMGRTPPDTHFVILTIEPFKGLNFVGEVKAADKEKIFAFLDKVKTAREMNARSVRASELVHNHGGRGGKYTASEMEFIARNAARHHKRQAMAFLNSFKTLHLYLNSIDDNKFIYFFSEGIYNQLVWKTKGGRSMYDFYQKNAARLLNRCGAMLFIINPMGAEQYFSKGVRRPGDSNSYSGEHGLRLMARESGGKYLEGAPKVIAQKIQHMNRAFYEASFPDVPGLKGNIRSITIKSNREGVIIHSLRSLEKSKTYAQMNDTEKEMTALNLVTNNSLMRNILSVDHAKVTQMDKGEKNMTYYVTLPPGFVKQNVDLYRVWVMNDSELVNIEREQITPQAKKMLISCRFPKTKPVKGKEDKDNKDNKDKSEPELMPYFVMVNSQNNKAVVRVIGDRWLEEKETGLAQNINKQKPAQTTALKSPDQLNIILSGAAEYCEKVKQSAFHYMSNEKIVETKKVLMKGGPNWRKQYGRGRRSLTNDELRRVRQTGGESVKKYVFSYRLIKDGYQIREERDWLSENKQGMHQNQVIRPTAFLAQRAVFAPLTLLAKERQDKYEYTFIRYDKYNGRDAAIIQAQPKNPGKSKTIYGSIWIDPVNFSIMKIEADPRSIRGYTLLKEQAKKLRTNLQLSLVTEFSHLHDGIRFPTNVTFVEKYKGGRNISRYWGGIGWERNRTVFTYSDYRFFKVNLEVSVQQ